MPKVANFAPALPPTPFLPRMTPGWSQVCRGPQLGSCWHLALRRERILWRHHDPSYLSLVTNFLCSLVSLFCLQSAHGLLQPLAGVCSKFETLIKHLWRLGEPGAPHATASGPDISLCQSRMTTPWCPLWQIPLYHTQENRPLGPDVLRFSKISPFQALILKNKEKVSSLTLTFPSYFSDSPRSTSEGNRLFFCHHICLLPYCSLMMDQCISSCCVANNCIS